MNLRGIISWLLVVAIGLILVSIWENSAEMRVASERLAQAREKVKGLEEQHNYLAQDIEKRNSEEYIESQIRNKFNMVKPGETVVILPPELQSQEEERQFYFEESVEQTVEFVPVWKEWVALVL